MENFKETRVGLVIDDLTGPINYQTCSDDDFYTRAEELGLVFTLKGFEQFIYTGELAKVMQHVQHPNYLIPRFMDVFESKDGYLYVDDKEKAGV